MAGNERGFVREQRDMSGSTSCPDGTGAAYAMTPPTAGLGWEQPFTVGLATSGYRPYADLAPTS